MRELRTRRAAALSSTQTVALDRNAIRFRALYNENYEKVLTYAMRRVAEPEDAADVLADTFLVAWRRIRDVPAGPNAEFWLYAVARRVIGNLRRGAGRREGLVERLRTHVREDQCEAPTSPVLESVRAALKRLPADDRELLMLITWEGLSVSEAATVLGVGRGAARTRLHRARNRLRDEIRIDLVNPDDGRAFESPGCEGANHAP